MKKQIQQGFTLIELMIVIAIIGILASIAIPQYQIYTQRTEATTSIAGIRTVQIAIQEHFSRTGSLPADLAALSNYGIVQQDLTDIATASDLIASVGITAATAVITLTYDTLASGVSADLAAKTLKITPSQSGGVITFGIDTSDAGTLVAKFRPNMPDVTAAAVTP